MLKAVDDVRKETPPRVWGRHKFFPAIPLGFRNTPTHVGKTVIRIRHMALAQKHPHACGEDIMTTPFQFLMSETPPRMWGRHQHIVFSGVLKRQIYNNCTPQGFRISINIHQTKKYVTI
ncbi:hypothetical protein ACYA7W_02760 [Klebsiella pneumoniae]|uniref:hypothetical protein n=1 Tax=Klebsiella pneumoniae TaxID=573 RepID=UPI000E2D0C75|nr:Domain of uncharacterised function (DUF2825) [Klebsiella pneumoniae]